METMPHIHQLNKYTGFRTLVSMLWVLNASFEVVFMGFVVNDKMFQFGPGRI